MSTTTSRAKRVLVGVIATLTLAGVGATTATASTALSAHGSHVSAKDWLGH